MPVDQLQLLSVAVFAAALLFVGALYHLCLDRLRNLRTRGRWNRALGHAARPTEGEDILRRRPRTLLQPSAPFNGLVARLERLIRQAGLTVPAPAVLFAMCVSALAAATAAVALVGGPPPLTAITAAAAIGLAIAAPVAGLYHLRSRRIARFAAQLPEALDVMVRSLRAGHPVGAAMALVGREIAEPLGGEVGHAIGEVTYGLDLRDALANLAGRVPLPDLQYFAAAINIQHETGGNLAEVLHALAGVIRARFRMMQKVRALSAEGRLSARLLAVLPIAFGGLMFAARPDFYLSVAGDPLFLPMLGIAVALELIGIAIMWRMVTLRV